MIIRMMMRMVMRMTKGMMRMVIMMTLGGDDEDDMKSWSLCESNVPQLLDLAPNEAGNLNEVYE